MSTRFETARFHILNGPPSLFERVKFKMYGERMLKLHGAHFNERMIGRTIPDEVITKLQKFNEKEWNVVTAEVRCDTGKFVNSTWEIMIENKFYWITIGFGDVIQTIIQKDSSGLGYEYTREGSLYQFVSEVNGKLMLEVE